MPHQHRYPTITACTRRGRCVLLVRTGCRIGVNAAPGDGGGVRWERRCSRMLWEIPAQAGQLLSVMDFVGCTGVTGVTAELSGFSGAFGSFGGSLDTAPSLSTRKVPSASTLAASFIGCPFPSASELLFPFGRLRIAASLGGTRCTGYGVSSTLFTAAVWPL